MKTTDISSKLAGLRRCFVNLCACAVLILCVPSAGAVTNITFTLEGNYTTSAAVYKPDGTLVATLWRKVAYPAGTHTATWDDNDDAGVTQPAGNYHFKLLYHNVDYVWEGVIGNTSSSFTGYPWRAYSPAADLAADGANLFMVMGYNEEQSGLFRFSSTDAQTPTYRLRKSATTALQHVATDGTWYYVANSGKGMDFGLNQSFVMAYNVSDNARATFTYGVDVVHQYRHPGEPYADHHFPSVIDNELGSANPPSGLAVQKSGSVLAVAHATQNEIRLFDKRSGLRTGSIPVTAPKRLAFAPNGDLWCVTETSVVRFSGVTLGATGTPAATISGLAQPVAVAVHPANNNIVLVGDGGASQQVKAYDSIGNALWTFGTAGGYKADPTVSTSKLAFPDASTSTMTFRENQSFITVLSDGSFWVSDGVNDRVLHISAGLAYLEQIMYLEAIYSMTVDPNNPTRVFAGFLEFQTDYTKPLLPGDPIAAGGNHSWKLLKNWGLVPAEYRDWIYAGLNTVVTLRNGRTYGLANNFISNRPAHLNRTAVVELPPSGPLRFTGIEIPWVTSLYGYPVWVTTLYDNGDLRYSSVTGGIQTVYKQALTGFDASNNPIWAAPVVLATSPATLTDPYHRIGVFAGVTGPRFPISSSNVMISFDQSVGVNGNTGMHLGGVNLGGAQWLWKASPAATTVDYTQQQDGTFAIGEGVNYGGNQVHVSGRNVLYGYHGEGHRQGQANQFMHFLDNGLFVGQFGVVNHPTIEDARVGLAGNAFSSALVQANGQTYLWHNDENNHGGVHRWRLNNLGSIRDLAANGALGGTITLAPNGLKGQYYNGRSFNTLITTRTDANVNFNWGTGSPATGVNVDSFSVRWTGKVTPVYSEAYTFFTSTDDGVRLWVNNRLIVDKWKNAPVNSSGMITLIGGQPYDIKMEYKEVASQARAKLEWRSASQPRVVVPQTTLRAAP